MAVYVAVADASYDKAIKFGPVEVDDPATYPTQMGTHLMLEEEALAAGYYYGDGAAVAPADGAGHQGQGKGHDKGRGKGHDKHGDQGSK